MKFHRIYYDDVMNGEGIRTTIFVSGCSHHCKGCYNQSTWSPDHGKPFTDEIVSEILDSLASPHVTGLSLTGGDPLYADNLDDILELVSLVKYTYGHTKNIWMWTGYTMEELQDFSDRKNYIRKRILQNVDVLIDGKFVEELKDPSLAWRGSSNQNIHRLTNKV